LSIQRIQSNARLSQVVIHGDTVYLTGQVGEPGDSVAAQTRLVLDRIDALLAQAGTSKANILNATIWLADMADFAEMNSVWDVWVDQANPPARATGEARLTVPGLAVEIIIIAALNK
jgi:enamine deaminase RidA (YjgF/YER057c/UK114 family)